MAETRSPWTEIVSLAVVAILLYHVGLLLVFFLVPMQILYLRRGEGGYRYGVLVFLCGVLVVKAVSLFTSRFVNVEPLLVSLDFLLPLAFLGALYIMNLDRLGRGRNEGAGRAVGVATRALSASVLGGLLSLPLLIYLVNSDTLMHVLRSQFQFAEQLFQQSASGSTGGAGSGAAPLLGPGGATPDQLVKASIDIFLRFYLFGFFLMVYFDWYLGTRVGMRMAVRPFSREDVERPEDESGSAAESPRTAQEPAGLVVPGYMLWVLIAAWVAILAGRFVALGPLSYAVWNLGLIVAFLYAVQGVAIVQHLFRMRNVSRGPRYLLVLTAIALLFVPIANLVVLAGFPLLGVSETWIHYRRMERSEK